MTDEEGKKLFKVVKTQSNSMKSMVFIETWDEAIKWFNEFEDEDSSEWYRRIVAKTVNEDYYAELEFIENHKGWGYDYTVRIEIDRIYLD